MHVLEWICQVNRLFSLSFLERYSQSALLFNQMLFTICVAIQSALLFNRTLFTICVVYRNIVKDLNIIKAFFYNKTGTVNSSSKNIKIAKNQPGQ